MTSDASNVSAAFMKILIVEDEPTSRLVLESLTPKWGFTPVSARNAEEAMEILKGDDPPLLIILDWILPGIDGLTLCKQIREMDWSIAPYIFFVTVKEKTEERVQALDAGANDYVTKPYNHDELRARLSVGRRVLTQQMRIEQQGQELARNKRRIEEATRALARSHEKYKSLVDNVSDIVWTYNIATNQFDFVSEAVSSILGYSEEEALAMGFSDLFKPKDVAYLGERIEKLVRLGKGKEEAELRLEHKHKYGHWVWLEVRYTILFEKEGKPKAISGISRDITERLNHERALEENEERWRAMFFENRAIKFLIDPETGLIEEANRTACDFYGYSHEQFSSLHIWDLNTAGEEKTRAKMKETLKAGSEQFIFKHKTKRGVLRDVQVFSSSIELNGKPYLYSIVIDITEKQKIERALAENRKRLEKAEIVAKIGHWQMDLKRNKTHASEGAKRIYGVVGEEWSIAEIQKAPLSEYRPKLDKALKNLVEDDAPYDIEFKITHWQTGEIVDVRSIAEYNKQEHIVFGIIHDITERKHYEAEHRKLQQQLMQAMKMESIGRLAGGVAHDFNNLLTGISGSVSLAMMENPENLELYDHLRQISEATNRASGLTKQLLAFSRKQILEPKSFNLNKLIENMVFMLHRLIGEDISMQFKPSEPIVAIHADPGQIEQVIMNLAVNARDAMPQGGTMLLETAITTFDEEYCKRNHYAHQGRYSTLTISDTGCGMDEATRQRIFEPFFTTKEQNKGTGLGLATIYGIVKQHKGYIEVYSELDKGTTFKIYLPESTNKTSEKEAFPNNNELEVLPKGRETVLLVEDEAIVRSVGVKLLSRLGYHVLEAETPEEAMVISRNREEPIHLLLTDVVLPEENGKELAMRFVQERPETKVLYTSGYPEKIISEQGLLNEGIEFIEKPFTPSKLAVKIREILEG